MSGFVRSIVERLPGSWQVRPGQALALGPIAAADLPKCNDSRRSERRVIPGSAGVADRDVICRWDGSTYAWADDGVDLLAATYALLTDLRFAPTGEMTGFAGVTVPAGWLLCDGSAVAKATYAALYTALITIKGTFTVTIASPGVFTLNAHGLRVSDQVFLTTTGALPTGLSANTNYFVAAASFGTNTFTLSATRGGSAINTSGTQSGTHTLTSAPWGISGGSNFLLPDMRGRALAGQDTSQTEFDNLGETGGAKTHTLTGAESGTSAHTHPTGTTTDRSVGHSHGFTDNTVTTVSTTTFANGAQFHVNPAETTAPDNTGGENIGHTHNFTTPAATAANATNAHNNLQPYGVGNWIIKT